MATATLEAISVSSSNLISIAGARSAVDLGLNQEITKYEDKQYWW
jgi:hypothetical protein